MFMSALGAKSAAPLVLKVLVRLNSRILQADSVDIAFGPEEQITTLADAVRAFVKGEGTATAGTLWTAIRSTTP